MIIKSVKKYTTILSIISTIITYTIVCEEINADEFYANQDLDDICSQTDNFDSVFMLRGQTFFKIGRKIWRINGTDIDIFTRTSDDQRTNFGRPNRMRQMEKLLNNFQIDLTRSIFAIDYQFEYHTNSCALSQEKLEQSECQLYKPGGMASFVCIFAFDIRHRGRASKANAQESWAFSYDSENFTEIQAQDLKLQVHNFCYYQLEYLSCKSYKTWTKPNARDHACQPVIRTGWSHMNLDKNNPYLKLYYQCIKTDGQIDFLQSIEFSLKSMNEIEYQFEYCNQSWVGYIRNKSMINGLYVPIGFNGGYYVFECENNDCHVWSQLNYLDKYNSNNDKKEEPVIDGFPKTLLTNTNHPKLSIDFFLRCQQHFKGSKRIQTPALVSIDDYLDDPDSICSQTDNIDSVFMLLGHTFFKVNGRIWRLNATRNKNPYQRSTDNWKTTVRVRDMEKILNNDSIDLQNPIFAFDYQFEYKNICSNYKTNSYNECHTIRPLGLKSFVCLYQSTDSSKNYTVRSYTYDSDSLWHIINKSLKVHVHNFCLTQLKYMLSNQKYNKCTEIRIGWSEIKPNIGWFGDTHPHLQIFYTCITQPSHMMSVDSIFYLDFDLIIPGNLDLNISSFRESSHKYSRTRYLSNRIFVPIAFKDGYYILSCFQDACHVWDKMYLVDQYQHRYPMETDLTQLVHYNGLEMSLSEILRCPTRSDQQKQQKNQFCDKQSFDSIFNLGEHIYFQSDGRFWRYNSSGSNNIKGGKQLINKSKNIRLESSMSTILDKYFDIRQRINGFTIEVCLENNLTDITNSTDRSQRELVCIYGTDKYSNFIFKSYLKSVSGLKEYQHDNQIKNDSALTICEKVYQPFQKNTSMRMLSVYLHKKLAKNDLISYYLDNTVTWPGHSDYNQLDSPWLGQQGGYLMIDQLTRTKIIGWFQNIFWDRSQDSFDGLFIYGSEYYMFHYNRTDWKINMSVLLHSTENYSEMFKETATNNWRISLFDYLNCTSDRSLDQLWSQFQLERQDPYDVFINLLDSENETLSVFNIGQNVYFQVGQQFYKYLSISDIRFESGFVHCKQVSELLNRIFDTNERVIGYSYNGFDKIKSKRSNDAHNDYYTVVLIGSPKLKLSSKLPSKLIAKTFEMNPISTDLTLIDQEQNNGQY